MLPITHGEDVTRRGILRYTFLTVISSFSLIYFIKLGLIYIISATILGALFMAEAYRVYYKKVPSKRLFFISIIYLFLLFASMLANHFFRYVALFFV